MTTDEPGADDAPVTLINVFEIAPEDADDFGEAWSDRARLMSTRPGFVSADLYRALDPDSRFQLINVARWASRQEFEAARADPEFQARVGRLGRSGRRGARRSDPALYRRMHGA